MHFKSLIGLLLAGTALGLAACGDLGATDEELAQARKRGEYIGAANATVAAKNRFSQTRHNVYLNGLEDGWDEGWEEAEEAFEEEREEGEIEGSEFDPTPEKMDGSESYEFEPDDIERAEEAPTDVQEYCEGAVSEAQELGCLSHVESSEVP